MHSRPVHRALAVLIVGLGISTVLLFAAGRVVAGVMGLALLVACLVAWVAMAARARRPDDPSALPFGTPRPANAPPDGHIRFTLVVEGLEPDRVAEVWS